MAGGTYLNAVDSSFQQPRTTPSVFATQGLSLPSLSIPETNPPELYRPDASPWASSASDSTYSTPASDNARNPRFWLGRHRSPTGEWQPTQLLSPYPNPTSTNPPRASLDSMFAGPFPSSQFSTTAHNPNYGIMLDVPMTGFGMAEQGGQPTSSPSSEMTFRPHHRHSTSLSSIRTAAFQTSGPLITPMQALPDRATAMGALNRQKEHLLNMANPHETFMSGGAAFNMLGELGGSFGEVSPGGSGSAGGLLAALDLPMTGCGVMGVGLASQQLPRQVLAAVPGYIEAYWRVFHELYPIVHRGSFESAGEEVLRWAMAAVATQYLDTKEDRLRGNQLHEHAWQELKRVSEDVHSRPLSCLVMRLDANCETVQIPQWNLQVMQAILLCEIFARFRGRKAVTRPSKMFESLYSRVSSALFPTAYPDNGVVSPLGPNAWSSGSGSASSFLSSAATTPISSQCFSRRPSSVHLQATPAQSVFFPYTLSRPLSVMAPSSPVVEYQPTSQTLGALYSHLAPDAQVLYHNPTLFDPAVPSADQDFQPEDRWHAWLDAEARRRLLTACFVTDVHTAAYQQQKRAHECDFTNTEVASSPTVPLTARSAALWEASSAGEWASLLAAEPEAGVPSFAQALDGLTAEDIQARPSFDRAAILALELIHLPRTLSRSSPTPPSTRDDDDPDPPTRPKSTPGYITAASPTSTTLQNHAIFPTPAVSNPSQPVPAKRRTTTTEERITALFPSCPRAATYLALHHTPLHDLLAVSGDTWIFSHKVLPATSFLGHQRRLKRWAEAGAAPSSSSSRGADADLDRDLWGLSAPRATIYAARAILAFLSRAGGEDGLVVVDDDGSPTTATSAGSSVVAARWTVDLSDYWALYVSALICWAFGHRAGQGQGQGNEVVGGGGKGRGGGGGTGKVLSSSDAEAVAWLRTVSCMGPEQVVRARGRREAGGVVRLVRRRLEWDCVGGRSRLYVDAVGVLKKLEEGVNWKWF